MSRRQSSVRLKNFPPLLRRLVRAAEAECPPGHAEALTVFISLALRKNAARGIVEQGTNEESELSAAIQSLARAHFEVDEAIAGWRRALTTADLASLERSSRDVASGSVPREPDAASFYAGLAFGLVFAGPCAVAA